MTGSDHERSLSASRLQRDLTAGAQARGQLATLDASGGCACSWCSSKHSRQRTHSVHCCHRCSESPPTAHPHRHPDAEQGPEDQYAGEDAHSGWRCPSFPGSDRLAASRGRASAMAGGAGRQEAAQRCGERAQPGEHRPGGILWGASAGHEQTSACRPPLQPSTARAHAASGWPHRVGTCSPHHAGESERPWSPADAEAAPALFRDSP